MKNILTTGSVIAGLSILDNIDDAMNTTAEKMKKLADILEEIDNNLEVDNNDEDLYL